MTWIITNNECIHHFNLSTFFNRFSITLGYYIDFKEFKFLITNEQTFDMVISSLNINNLIWRVWKCLVGFTKIYRNESKTNSKKNSLDYYWVPKITIKSSYRIWFKKMFFFPFLPCNMCLWIIWNEFRAIFVLIRFGNCIIHGCLFPKL